MDGVPHPPARRPVPERGCLTMWVETCPTAPVSGACPVPSEWIDLGFFMAGPGQLDLLGITPEQVLYVFSWGFATVVAFWSLGFALRVAAKVISRA